MTVIPSENITWNLLLNDAPADIIVILLTDTGKSHVRKQTGIPAGPVRVTGNIPERWYGALFYDLRGFKSEIRIYGSARNDYGNPSVTRKIIDILSFRDDGDPVFGRKIFESGKELKYREVLEYSSEAVITVKFLNDKTIVFDHLVPISPQLKGQKEFYGPDFSYDSYNLDKGLWRYRSTWCQE